MKLTESKNRATCAVIESEGFADVLEAKLFASCEDAEAYADYCGGRVVDRDGLAEKFESMHRAEGRQPHRSMGGRFVEIANEEEMESFWKSEYMDAADSFFKHETVWEIEPDGEPGIGSDGEWTPEQFAEDIGLDPVDVHDLLSSGNPCDAIRNLSEFQRTELLGWCRNRVNAQ